VSLHDTAGFARLGVKECWRLVRAHGLGRVGFVHLGDPMVFPVNYVVHRDSIVLRTELGTTLHRAATTGQRAVLEVDEVSDALEIGASVLVHGTLHAVVDRLEVDQLRRVDLHPWAPGARDQFVRILPAWLSGRAILGWPTPDGLLADGG
jgi:nitroimidazol reductase NimA-like FMN-containing flavoprotein (pyridoxamine 5'-phosphate oxidase superfamily)